MGVFDERKIDCHVHVLDPAGFPYAPDATYRPSAQEIGTADKLVDVLECYGVQHALLVQPNSGYGPDNSCMLDAIRRWPAIFKGVAIAALDADLAELRALKAAGIVGIALNPTYYGNVFYADAAPLMEKLAELEMFVQIQVQHEQLLMFKPWIETIPVRVLIDHCARPTPGQGLGQAGFKALLELAETRRVYVKLSGYAKFAETPFPFRDTWPFIHALVEAFGVDRCMWASDWPFLRAADRQDYGPLLKLVELLFPDPSDRDVVLWQTPRALFGFGD